MCARVLKGERENSSACFRIVKSHWEWMELIPQNAKVQLTVLHTAIFFYKKKPQEQRHYPWAKAQMGWGKVVPDAWDIPQRSKIKQSRGRWDHPFSSVPTRIDCPSALNTHRPHVHSSQSRVPTSYQPISEQQQRTTTPVSTRLKNGASKVSESKTSEHQLNHQEAAFLKIHAV